MLQIKPNSSESDHYQSSNRTHNIVIDRTPLPPPAAENLLFFSLPNTHVSAETLAENLKHNLKKSKSPSLETDEFVSCVEENEDIDLDGFDPKEESDHMAKEAIMDTENQDLDPTQHVYGGFKNVWSFVRNDCVLTKPFAKIAEDLTGKVLDMSTGGSLNFEKIDQDILSPHLAKIDKDVLNPTISGVVAYWEDKVTYSDSVVRPLILSALHHVPFVDIKDKDEKEETKPEVVLPTSAEPQIIEEEITAVPEVTRVFETQVDETAVITKEVESMKIKKASSKNNLFAVFNKKNRT